MPNHRISLLLFLTVVSILVCASPCFSGSGDSLDIVFRFEDRTHIFKGVFVPGDFNGWGPNSSGVIDSSAPCRMRYDSLVGAWVKKVRLQTGSSHSYKFYTVPRGNGWTGTWIQDPLNPAHDNNGNSLIGISDPMFFEPHFVGDGTTLDSLITVGISGTAPPFTISIIRDGQAIGISTSFDAVRGLLLWHGANSPVPLHDLDLRIVDAQVRSVNLDTWHAPTPPAYTIPAWAKSCVWYQIFPERFRNGDPSNDPVRSSLENPANVSMNWHLSSWTADWYQLDTWEQVFYHDVFDRRYGGDLQGVLDKVGYLDSLGVNAIYLNPVFYSSSLHKYNAKSLHHIDPYFGPNPSGDLAMIAAETLDSTTWHRTSADSLFLRLIKEIHKHNMRVIIDMVFQATGSDFPAFADVVKNQQNSQYRDWYQILSWDDPATPGSEFRYGCYYGIGGFPLTAHSPDETDIAAGPKHYIYQCTRRWMDPDGNGNVRDGVDGFRLDSPTFVPDKFWADWNTWIRTLNPDVYTTAENWSYSYSMIVNDRFSGVMNYDLSAYPMYYLFPMNGKVSDFANAMSANVGSGSQNLLDSHDTHRIGSIIRNAGISSNFSNPSNPSEPKYDVSKPSSSQRKLQRLEVFAQMTVPGSPMIYYGDEAGMWGATDPDNRKPMPWPDVVMAPEKTDPRGYARQADDANFDTSMANYYRRVVHLRRTSPALQQGSWQVINVSEAQHSLIVRRRYNNDDMVVCINRDTVAHSVNFSAGKGMFPSIAGSTEYDQSVFQIQQVDSIITMTLPPLSGIALQAAVPLSVNGPSMIPSTFTLENAYPNPANPVTIISYVLPDVVGGKMEGSGNRHVRLTIYDLLGREVAVLADSPQSPGRHAVPFDARNLASGVYLYRLTAGSFTATKRFVVVK
jgi:glycosidase